MKKDKKAFRGTKSSNTSNAPGEKNIIQSLGFNQKTKDKISRDYIHELLEDQKIMTHYLYILKDKKPVQAQTAIEWSLWLVDFQQQVGYIGRDKINDSDIYTVFIGIDEDFLFTGTVTTEPLLFETKVFGGPMHEHSQKCATWEQAEAQHQKVVQLVKDKIENS